MNKMELVAAIAAKSGMTKKASEAALNCVIESITEELKNGGKVSLTGFGTFEVKERAARTGKNPRTGEVVEIAASKAPSFKVGKSLKDAVNQ